MQCCWAVLQRMEERRSRAESELFSSVIVEGWEGMEGGTHLQMNSIGLNLPHVLTEPYEL